MTTFFTSDTHLGHANIARLANRPHDPDDVAAMNRALVEDWNAVVGPNDTVWHLGDLALGLLTESLQVASHLNGTKILVPGNHDRVWSGNKRRESFLEAYEQAGFTVVAEQMTTTIGGTQVLLCHFPYVGDSHDDTDRYVDHRPIDLGVPLVHGHVHQRWGVRRSPAGTVMLNVGVDAGWGFAPLSEEQVHVILSTEMATT